MNKIHSAHVHFFPIPRSLLSQKSPILCPVILKVERFCLPFCLLRFPQISIARLCPVTGANDNKTHSFRFCYSSFLHRHPVIASLFSIDFIRTITRCPRTGTAFWGDHPYLLVSDHLPRITQHGIAKITHTQERNPYSERIKSNPIYGPFP